MAGTRESEMEASEERDERMLSRTCLWLNLNYRLCQDGWKRCDYWGYQPTGWRGLEPKRFSIRQHFRQEL